MTERVCHVFSWLVAKKLQTKQTSTAYRTGLYMPGRYIDEEGALQGPLPATPPFYQLALSPGAS